MKKTRQVERMSQLPQIPPLPPWPTSRSGPMITPPPPSQKRLLSRTDQVVEIAYDPERGRSAVRSKEK